MRGLALVADAFGGYGGIAQSTQDILSSIVRLSVAELTVLPRRGPDIVSGLPERIVQLRSRQGRAAFTLAAVSEALRTRPDFIYCGHLFMAPLAALLARLTCAPLAVHVHGLEIWTEPGGLRRRALASADAIFCVSEDTARRVRKATGLPARKTPVIFNTVRSDFTPQDRQLARQMFGWREETVLLTVSRLDARQRHKGHDRVIPLLAGLNASAPNTKPVIYAVAGEGDDRARLEDLARACEVTPFVRFLGRVPHEHLPSLYSAADLYVMPSHGEGFGIAFVEAMCCGTPAIGLAIGGAPDALCHGELGTAVAEKEFPATLAALVGAPQPDRAQLSRAAKSRFGPNAFDRRVAEALNRFLPAATRGASCRTVPYDG